MVVDTATNAAIEIRDLVVSTGTRHRERVLVAGLDLTVLPTEVVTLEVTAPDALDALLSVLAGVTAPTYGSLGAGRLPVVAPDDLGAEGPCVVDARITVGTSWAERLIGRPAATLVIGRPGDLGAVPAGRRYRLADGTARLCDAPRETFVAVDRLLSRVRELLTAAGTPAATAQLVGGVLVDADVRGHHSHGVQLLPMYLDRLAAGGIDPLAEPSWTRRTGVVRRIDAHGGFGQVAAELAVRECVQVARTQGLSAVGVAGNNHIGMLAAYRKPFIEAGIVGLILNISGPGVAAPAAPRATMGNNAVCMIAPDGPDGTPLICDFATGTVASGKIRAAASTGRTVPAGWLVDAEGRPTTDPLALDAGGAVPVFGGHKGLAVSVIVEVLAGMLGGATISPQVNKQRQQPARAMDCAQLFIGLDPRVFGSPDIGLMSAALRDVIAAGYGDDLPPIYFPEQLEQRCATAAEGRGVPLPRDLARQWSLGESAP
jgi:LDH2 family malate/lactate/ureidoglycolate dehydrogenase